MLESQTHTGQAGADRQNRNQVRNEQPQRDLAQARPPRAIVVAVLLSRLLLRRHGAGVLPDLSCGG